jgi:N-acetylglucosamine kinase-like BadF-type ATPase
MAYYLGVDIGNTKSHALIADENGRVMGQGMGGCGNHEVVGREGLHDTLHQIVQEAINNAHITPNDIHGAGFGIAGFDWESDRPLHDEIIATLGISAPYGLVNDALIGLIAGSSEGWGVAVTAGTSGNCRGRDKRGQEGRLTGNGAWFGEYGGGIELVYKGLEGISRAWSRRAPSTQLSELYVARVGAKDVTDMLEGLARGRYRLSATDAPLVFEAAKSGDRVAKDAIQWISKELANLAIGVIRQLNFENLLFEVVLAGSFYKGSRAIEEIMLSQIHTVAPLATFVKLDTSPVVGGVLLGMEKASVPYAHVRQTLIANTRELLREGA